MVEDLCVEEKNVLDSFFRFLNDYRRLDLRLNCLVNQIQEIVSGWRHAMSSINVLISCNYKSSTSLGLSYAYCHSHIA